MLMMTMMMTMMMMVMIMKVYNNNDKLEEETEPAVHFLLRQVSLEVLKPELPGLCTVDQVEQMLELQAQLPHQNCPIKTAPLKLPH